MADPKITRRGSAALAALVAGGVVLCMLAASVARAAYPEIMAVFSPNGVFTFTLNGTAVAGTTIPAGTYVIAFDNSVAANVNLQLNGPGVAISTTVGGGEPGYESDQVTFSANSSYTAQNLNAPGSSISFNTSSTTGSAAGGSGSGSSGSSGGSSGSGGGGLYGGGSTTTTATPARLEGTLTGTVSAEGALKLTFKDKIVAELSPGRYSLSVTDKSKSAGFVLKQAGKSAITVTTGSFVGKHSQTITMTSGQWDFSPSTTGKKTYFVVFG